MRDNKEFCLSAMLLGESGVSSVGDMTDAATEGS